MEGFSRYIRDQLNQQHQLKEEFRRQAQEERERGLGRRIVAPDPTGEGYIVIVNRLVPYSSIDFHTCYIGKTGSGKNLGGFDRHQCSYFQLKTTKPKYFLHLLAKENPEEQLALKAMARRNGLEFGKYRIDKVDQDSIAIDIGGTIHESRSPRLTIDQLSQAMFPKDSSSNQFFPTTASQIVSMMILGLRMAKGRDFGLPEIVDLGLNKTTTLVELMKRTERGRDLAEAYFPSGKSNETSHSINATIKAQVTQLEAAANVEYIIRTQAPQRLLTVRQLITGASRSTIFFAPTEFMGTYQPILDFILKLVGNTITSLSADNSRIITLFVDELPVFGYLKALPRLVTLARSTGFRQVMVFQDLTDLDRLYGKQAESMVGNCDAFGIFNGSSPRTTKFISERLGGKDVYTATPSFNESSISYNFECKPKPNLEPFAIYELNAASKQTGIEAYVALPKRFGGVQRIHIEAEEIDRQMDWFRNLATEQQALDARPAQQVKRPPLFSDPERMRILQAAFDSDRILEAYMEGYDEDNPETEFRIIAYQIMKRMVDKNNEELIDIMRNHRDDD